MRLADRFAMAPHLSATTTLPMRQAACHCGAQRFVAAVTSNGQQWQEQRGAGTESWRGRHYGAGPASHDCQSSLRPGRSREVLGVEEQDDVLALVVGQRHLLDLTIHNGCIEARHAAQRRAPLGSSSVSDGRASKRGRLLGEWHTRRGLLR